MALIKRHILLMTLLLLAGVVNAGAARNPGDCWKSLELEYGEVVSAQEKRSFKEVVGLTQNALPRSMEEWLFLEYYRSLGKASQGNIEGARHIVDFVMDSLKGAGDNGDLDYFLFRFLRLQSEITNYYGDAGKSIEQSMAAISLMERHGFHADFKPHLAYYELGETYQYTLGKNDRAMLYYERANEFTERDRVRDSLFLGRLYYSLSGCRQAREEFDLAEGYLDLAFDIASHFRERMPVFYVNCLGAYAVLHYQKHNYAEAVVFARRGIEERLKDPEWDLHDKLVTDYNNLSTYQYELADYKASLENLQKAMYHWTHSSFPDSILYASLKIREARLAEENKDWRKAESLYRYAAGIKEREFGQEHAQVVGTRYMFGEMLSRKGEVARALDIFDQIIQDIERSGGREELDENIQYLLRSYHQRGKLLAKSYQENERSIPVLEDAFRTFLAADSVLMEYRDLNEWRKSSQYMAEHYREIYNDALEVALELASTGSSNELKESIFQFFEHNKSMLLNETRRMGASLANLNDEREEMRELKSEVEQLKLRLAGATGRTDSSLILAESDQANRKYMRRVKEKMIHSGRGMYEVAGLPEVRQRLDEEGSGMLQFYDADSAFFALYLDGETLVFYRIEKDSDFRAMWETMFHHLHGRADLTSYREFEGFRWAAGGLYDRLLTEGVREAVKRKRKIWVVPDGDLSFLPFEALLDAPSDPKRLDYAALPYLVRNRQVSYLYSASLWPEYGSSNHGEGTMLAVAYGGSGLAELPFAKEELAFLSKSFKGRFFPEGCSKDQVEGSIGDVGIIHFATHARPESYGGTIFMGSGEEEERLESYEIENWSLEGRLVALNACETAQGKLLTGEGVYSLARSFFSAGASVVLSNLWKTSDEATYEISRGFYERLRRGQSPDVSLYRSKVQFLDNADGFEAHPVFWAAMIDIGNMGSIFSSKRKTVVLSIIAALLMSAMLLGLYWKIF